MPASIFLMDLRMPLMNGYEAAMAVRKLNCLDKELPIIAMTADAFSGIFGGPDIFIICQQEKEP